MLMERRRRWWELFLLQNVVLRGRVREGKEGVNRVTILSIFVNFGEKFNKSDIDCAYSSIWWELILIEIGETEKNRTILILF